MYYNRKIVLRRCKMNFFNELKELILQMNELDDEISFLKYNLESGPKFSSVKEMKKFICCVENNCFDFLFDNEDINSNSSNKPFVESFSYTKDNIYFFIYTLKKYNSYETYLSIKINNDIINNLCGKKSDDKDIAHKYLRSLEIFIMDHSIDEIINNLIIKTKNIIEDLKIELQNLTGTKN